MRIYAVMFLGAFVLACGGTYSEGTTSTAISREVSKPPPSQNVGGKCPVDDGKVFIRDSQGQYYEVSPQNGNPICDPAPGSTELSVPANRQLLLESRISVGAVPRSFSDLQIILFLHFNVKIYCDDQICDRPLSNCFPEFYQPTWREYFNCISRASGSQWVYVASGPDVFGVSRKTNRGFERIQTSSNGFLFAGPPEPFPYALQLAENWRIENRGVEIGYIPPTAPAGMDIYIFGEISPRNSQEEERSLHFWALQFASNFKPDVTIRDMQQLNKFGTNVLYFEIESGEKLAAKWRQWVFIAKGRCFVIVSAIKPEQEEELWPSVRQMVDSFQAQ